MGDLVIGAFALFMVFIGGVWPRLTARARYRRDRAALSVPDIDDRINAVARICGEGLDRNARILLETAEAEKNPAVLDALVDGICLRQWEPGRSDAIRALREFARGRLSDEGKLSRFLPPALNRAADLGGPRRDAWRANQIDKPDPAFVARSLEQLWDDLGRIPLTITGPKLELTIDFGGDADLGSLRKTQLPNGAMAVAGKRFDANYQIEMRSLPERGVQARSMESPRPNPGERKSQLRRRRESAARSYQKRRPHTTSPFARSQRHRVIRADRNPGVRK